MSLQITTFEVMSLLEMKPETPFRTLMPQLDTLSGNQPVLLMAESMVLKIHMVSVTFFLAETQPSAPKVKGEVCFDSLSAGGMEEGSGKKVLKAHRNSETEGVGRGKPSQTTQSP